MRNVTASILAIGDELLIGATQDTNSWWICRELDEAGITVVSVRIVGDKEGAILHALGDILSTADIVLVTGGLGPTRDDLTKGALAKFFRSELALNKQVLAELEARYTALGRKLSPAVRDQAMLPGKCVVVRNTLGTAPGMWFEENGKLVVSMPGVPREMKHMLSQEVLPKLCERYNPPSIRHRYILTAGIAEAALAEMLSGFEDTIVPGAGLAYLPGLGEVKLRLSATGGDIAGLDTLLDNEVKRVQKIIGKYVFGSGTETLEGVVGETLRKKKLTLSTAESCTGGYIAHLITSVAGSSDYFLGSVVSYSNEIKKKILGVSDKTLKAYGAVSEQTAVEMARGVRAAMGSDVSIAVTGIAGPGGGTDEKPVGTVWVAVDNRGEVSGKLFRFGGDRQANIVLAAVNGLNMIREVLGAAVVR